MSENRVVGEGNPYILLDLLGEAVVPEDDVMLESYCDFWLELCGFLKKFGTLFGFVTKDILPKVATLKQFLEENEEGYRSIGNMANHERREDTIYSESPRSGMMLLLSLHKAQVFLILLIQKISESQDDDRMRVVASGVYDETLGNYHSWTVRLAVKAAMFLLPNKEEFLKIMRGSMPPSEDDAFHERFTRDSAIMKNRIEEIFSEHNIQL